jgi:hypothetical protein
MTQIRNRLSLSARLFALAGSASLEPSRTLIHDRPGPPPAKRQANKKIRYGNNVPHQGRRECARRRGGQDWDTFRASDRIRRGLPVSWPYQAMA